MTSGFAIRPLSVPERRPRLAELLTRIERLERRLGEQSGHGPNLDDDQPQVDADWAPLTDVAKQKRVRPSRLRKAVDRGALDHRWKEGRLCIPIEGTEAYLKRRLLPR